MPTGMAAHPDRHVSPLRVDNVEKIVIDQRQLLGRRTTTLPSRLFLLARPARALATNRQTPLEVRIDGRSFAAWACLSFSPVAPVAQRNLMLVRIGFARRRAKSCQLGQSSSVNAVLEI